MGDNYTPAFDSYRQLAGAVAGIGITVADKILAAEARMQYTAANETAVTAIKQFNLALQQDPNWQGYEEKSSKALDEIWKQLEPKLTNPDALHQMQSDFSRYRAEQVGAVGDYQNKQRIGEALSNLNYSIDSAMKDATLPAEERKKKITQMLADAYQTNLIDNPTRGAKLADLLHTIDIQDVAQQAWDVQAVGGDYLAWLSDKNHQQGLLPDEIQSVATKITQRVNEMKAQAKQAEQDNNTPIETSLSTALGDFISGNKKGQPMTWAMLTAARAQLQGRDGTDIYDRYVAAYDRALAQAAADGGGSVDPVKEGPFLSMVFSAEKTDLEKGALLAEAFAAGKFNSNTWEHLMSIRKDSSPAISMAMTALDNMARPDPSTGGSALVSYIQAAQGQTLLREAIEKNPKMGSTEILVALSQVQTFIKDETLKSAIDEAFTSKGTVWDWLSGNRQKGMAAVTYLQKQLQSGAYSEFQDTPAMGMVLNAAKNEQVSDLSSILKSKSTEKLAFTIDPTLTRAIGNGVYMFKDQLGNAYEYGPGKAGWGWYTVRSGASAAELLKR